MVVKSSSVNIKRVEEETLSYVGCFLDINENKEIKEKNY